ncbi:MAG: hypothetical protein ACIAXF_00550 [Phycisphaerales bacterium JB063]
MKHHPPAAPGAPPRRRPRQAVTALLTLALLLAATPLTGCVELSRTEKSRYGNPLQSYSAGPSNRFEADSYKPPTLEQKPWYQRLFDW